MRSIVLHHLVGYLRAIETLARVRRVMGVPMLQLNIAAEGGQQVVTNI